jgi:hypothetical protein
LAGCRAGHNSKGQYSKNIDLGQGSQAQIHQRDTFGGKKSQRAVV